MSHHVGMLAGRSKQAADRWETSGGPPPPAPKATKIWVTAADGTLRKAALVWGRPGLSHLFGSQSSVLHTDADCASRSSNSTLSPTSAPEAEFAVRELLPCSCVADTDPLIVWLECVAAFNQHHRSKFDRPNPPVVAALSVTARHSILDAMATHLKNVNEPPKSPARTWVAAARTALQHEPPAGTYQGAHCLVARTVGETAATLHADDNAVAEAARAWSRARASGCSAQTAAEHATTAFSDRLAGSGQGFDFVVQAHCDLWEDELAGTIESYEPYGTHLLRYFGPPLVLRPGTTPKSGWVDTCGWDATPVAWRYATVKASATHGPMYVDDLNGQVFAVPAVVAAHCAAESVVWEDLGQLTDIELEQLACGETPLVVALLPALAGTRHVGIDQLEVLRLLAG